MKTKIIGLVMSAAITGAGSAQDEDPLHLA